jgi:hypothetical protein
MKNADAIGAACEKTALIYNVRMKWLSYPFECFFKFCIVIKV